MQPTVRSCGPAACTAPGRLMSCSAALDCWHVCRSWIHVQSGARPPCMAVPGACLGISSTWYSKREAHVTSPAHLVVSAALDQAWQQARSFVVTQLVRLHQCILSNPCARIPHLRAAAGTIGVLLLLQSCCTTSMWDCSMWVDRTAGSARMLVLPGCGMPVCVSCGTCLRRQLQQESPGEA